MPLAYPTLAPLYEGWLTCADFDTADLLVFGHPDDVVEAAGDVAGLRAARPGARLVYLSEEPFWDTVGPIPPFRRTQVLDTAAGPLPITCLTHATSTIFDFDRIPYFLLTDAGYAARYAARFAANRRLAARDWAEAFARRPLRAGFVAENRLSPKLDVRFDDHGVRGLCTYRTEVAIRSRRGPVLRAGRGWPAGVEDRVALEDWHGAKLRWLDRQCLLLSALENTHQPNYVSEKIFDAFAIGAVPLYYAAPDHDVHRILPEGGFVNLYGLDPGRAAAVIDAFEIDEAFLDRYVAAQNRLADLFCDPAPIAAERERLKRALLGEFEAILAAQPRS